MYVFIKKMIDENELIEDLKIPIWLKKLNIIYRKKFNIVTIKKLDKNRILYIIPKVENSKKVKKIINKNKKSKILLSNNLNKYSEELQIEYNNITRYFIFEILKYFEDKSKEKIEMLNIHILANEYNQANLEIINSIINKVKTVTIVTNNIKQYKIYEENVYNKTGNLINITNNKNRGLKKANIIINLDFLNEDIDKYRINKDSIIINAINNKLTIAYFQGIIVNSIQIDLKEKDEYCKVYKDFNNSDIFISYIVKNRKYSEIINVIKEEDIDVINLIGNNGIIEMKEIKQYYKKILTNDKKSTNI